MALRKRGKRAWQRAMRANGPFAPGSIVGAVAAENHRLSVHLGTSATSSSAEDTGRAAGNDGSSKVPLEATTSLRSMAHGGGGGGSVAGTMLSANSAGDDLSRVSQAFSEASSYHTVASDHPEPASPSSIRRSPSSWHSAHHRWGTSGGSSHGASSTAGPSGRGGHGLGGSRPYEHSHFGPGGSSPRTPHNDGGSTPFSHSSHPAIEAFRAWQLGFGFSGGGFLFPWHLGVVTELKDMGVINHQTQLAGASCGAIIVTCVNSGLDLHDLVGELLKVRMQNVKLAR